MGVISGEIPAPPPPPSTVLDWVGEAAKLEWLDAKEGLSKVLPSALQMRDEMQNPNPVGTI
eukprot:1178846-Prorocentrum_minimum.AAC.1